MRETETAMKWFLNSGLCVNRKKTEVCFKNLGNQCPQNMKILGLIFVSKLNWNQQTVTAIEKANKTK
jgi:hypothetical protein